MPTIDRETLETLETIPDSALYVCSRAGEFDQYATAGALKAPRHAGWSSRYVPELDEWIVTTPYGTERRTYRRHNV